MLVSRSRSQAVVTCSAVTSASTSARRSRRGAGEVLVGAGEREVAHGAGEHLGLREPLAGAVDDRLRALGGVRRLPARDHLRVPEQPAGRDRAPQARLEAEAVLDHEVREVVGQARRCRACCIRRRRARRARHRSGAAPSGTGAPFGLEELDLRHWTCCTVAARVRPASHLHQTARRGRRADAPAHGVAEQTLRGRPLRHVSGRQIPRTGGVILAHGDDRDEMEALAAGDPFVTGGVATVEVIQFRAAHQI